VILTTSTFLGDAHDFGGRIEGRKVVLIDGDQSADFMIAPDFGVNITPAYRLKEVSNDFFAEDE
jgi:restriction system protein